MTIAGDQAVPKVVVWLTQGGVIEYVSSGTVQLEIIDFQNLEAGDVAPELSPEVRAWLRSVAPALLSDLEPYQARFECQNCGQRFWNSEQLDVIQDLHQRVAPGESMPAGECPRCQALVSVVATEEGS